MIRGFYIGRFQPYHEGHHRMVERITEDVDELVLGVGSADGSHTTHDPFTAGERIMMITKALAGFDLVTYVVPIEDIDRNSVWVSHITSMCPRFDVAYSNNPLVIQLFEEAGVPVRQSPMFHREVLEGTQIRERMIAGENWQELVPNVVAETIEGIDGVSRLQHLDGNDGVDAEDPKHVERIDDVEDIEDIGTVADLSDTDPSG